MTSKHNMIPFTSQTTSTSFQKVLPFQRIPSARDRSRIDEKSSLVFVSFEFVGVTANQDINVELSANQRQGFQVTPWHDLDTIQRENTLPKWCKLQNYNIWFETSLNRIASPDVHDRCRCEIVLPPPPSALANSCYAISKVKGKIKW